MYLQLHLHERKVLPIGNMSVANCHASLRDNIHRDSLAQWHVEWRHSAWPAPPPPSTRQLRGSLHFSLLTPTVELETP